MKQSRQEPEGVGSEYQNEKELANRDFRVNLRS